MKYLVRWEIDAEAGSPKEAAAFARAAQLRPDTIATVFEVRPEDDPTKCFVVDLSADTVVEGRDNMRYVIYDWDGDCVIGPCYETEREAVEDAGDLSDVCVLVLRVPGASLPDEELNDCG